MKEYKFSHDLDDSASSLSSFDHGSGGGWLSRSKSALRCRCCNRCSRRTKWIICGVVATPFAVLLVLIIAAMIKTAFVDDPFELMELEGVDSAKLGLSDEEMVEISARLAEAISIRTISYAEDQLSLDEQEELNELIESSFPLVHSSSWITRWMVNTHSRLYRVEGTEATANPYLLMGHMDVVPEGDEEEWQHSPFDAGVVKDGSVIFGRGAIDCKHQVFGILEVLERLVAKGKRPKRSFYVAFGHDEEVSGYEGALFIAERLEAELEARGEELSFVLDEGMFVMEDIFPGVADPVIYVGVQEKGWALVDLVVSGEEQGHSSTPPRESAIGILADGVRKLEEHRHPNRFGDGVEKVSIDYVASHANFFYKMAMGNLWLTEPFVSMVFAADPDTDAVQRTTTALTMFDAGVKENVMPSEASAVVNHRLHPADDIKEVLERDEDYLDDDRIDVELRDEFKATPIARYDNDFLPYQIIVNSAMEVWSDGIPVPGLMVANTDTIHYQHLCVDCVYRFSPVYVREGETDWFHGVDEQISVDDYRNVIEFYHRLMLNADYDIDVLQ